MDGEEQTSKKEWDDELWNTKMRSSWTPIEYLQRALTNNANVAKLSSYGGSPLAWLLCDLDVRDDMVQLMVEAGAKSKNKAEQQFMFRGYVQRSSPTMLQYLFDQRVFESIEFNDFSQAFQNLVRMCNP